MTPDELAEMNRRNAEDEARVIAAHRQRLATGYYRQHRHKPVEQRTLKRTTD